MARMKQKPYLVYAINAQGALVHIDMVENGEACNCICPHCKSKLIAKNGGEKKAKHFAHTNGSDCVGAVESAQHLLAKEILCENLKVMLPEIPQIQSSMILCLDRVEKEKSNLDLSLRPDCIGYYNDNIIWIEFKRSHAVDVYKESKIISAQIDCIEIDLKDCDQDKEKMRHFICEESNNRKWIYNSKLRISQSCRKPQSGQIEDYGYWEKPRIEKHFAIEKDKGRLVDLMNDYDIDYNSHTYVCPSCHRKVLISVDESGNYSFVHEDNINCDDSLYLKMTAIEMIYKTFIDSSEFYIDLPKQHRCNEQFQCPLYTEQCFVEKIHAYNLKKCNYNSCVKNIKLESQHILSDIIFSRGNNYADAIIVDILTEDIDECNEYPNHRALQIYISNEDNIRLLRNGHICQKQIKRYNCNFNFTTNETVNFEEIENKFVQFTFYKSGKFYTQIVKCDEARRKVVRPNVMREVLFKKATGDYSLLRNILLCKYQKEGLKLFYCRICYFLKHNPSFWGDSYICTRYKTKGTPRNPLESKPVGCPYFMLNKEIIRSIEEQVQDIEYVEVTSKN